MRESESVANAVQSLADAINRGDGEAILALHSPDVRLIGTDDGEKYDFASYGAWVRAHTNAVRVELRDVHAFEHGHVGWMDATMIVTFQGERYRQRLTGVLLRAAGAWAFVHRHASVGLRATPDDA